MKEPTPGPLHDEAWGTGVQTALAEINTHIATAQGEVENSNEPDLRQRETNLIGLLITARQKLERAVEPIQSKSPSLLTKLKSKLGLDDNA